MVLKLFQTKKREFSPAEREDILCMREDGMKPSEIATQLGADPEKVSNILKVERRKYRKYQDDDDPIEAMNVEIKRMELEKKKLELEWAIEDKKADRSAEIMQYMQPEDPGEEYPWWANIVTPLLQNLISQKKGEGGLNPHLTPGTAMTPTPGNTPGNGGQPQRLTDGEINQILQNYPKQVKQLRKMPEKIVTKSLEQYFPNFTPDTYTRASKLITGKKEVLS